MGWGLGLQRYASKPHHGGISELQTPLYFFFKRSIRLQLRSAPISSADCYIRFPHTTVFFFSGSGAIFNWCCELKIALHPRETRSGAGIAWHPWMIGEGGTFKTATAPRWALWEADASI